MAMDGWFEIGVFRNRRSRWRCCRCCCWGCGHQKRIPIYNESAVCRPSSYRSLERMFLNLDGVNEERKKENAWVRERGKRICHSARIFTGFRTFLFGEITRKKNKSKNRNRKSKWWWNLKISDTCSLYLYGWSFWLDAVLCRFRATKVLKHH